MRKVIMVHSNWDDFDSFLGEGSICWSDMRTKSTIFSKSKEGEGRKNVKDLYYLGEYRQCIKVGLRAIIKFKNKLRSKAVNLCF